MKIVKITGAVLSAAAIMSFSTGAWALDGKDFAKKLSAIFETGGLSVSFDDVVVAGDVVTLSDPTFAPVGEDPAKVEADMIFTGVSEAGDGGYLADKGEIAQIVFENPDEEIKVVVENILIEDVKIPADAYGDPTATFDAYSRFSMGQMNVSTMKPGAAAGTDIFSIASIDVTNTVSEDLNVVENTYVVDGIFADLTQIDEPEAQAMLGLFELTKIDARMQGASTWTLDDGRINLTESAIIINNVGKLDVTADILGYDLAMITEMQKMQKEVMADHDKSAVEMDMADMDMLMSMVDRLLLASATVRFDDDGITNKILDFVAEQQGAPREVLAAGFAAAVPAMAAEAGMPAAVQTMLLNAATAFLADPSSLEISVAPEAPVAFSKLGEAADDPVELTDLLNISIVANQ